MRLFTAIPLPKELKEQIADLTRGRLPVPYINTTNLHVTLNFFGDLSDAEAETVKQIFQRELENGQQFLIELESLIKFRNQIRLTVRKSDPLMTLQLKLERAFGAAGFRFQDRTYYPHVKLTNLHMDKVMNPERKLENFPNDEIAKLTFTATEVVLYESKLLLHHAKHIPKIQMALR